MVLKRGLPSKITSTKGVEKKKMGEDNAPIVAATGTPDAVPAPKETKQQPSKQAKKSGGTKAEQKPNQAQPDTNNDNSAVEEEIKKGVEREMMATGTADMPEPPAPSVEPESADVPAPKAEPAAAPEQPAPVAPEPTPEPTPAPSAMPSFGSPPPSAEPVSSPSPFGSPVPPAGEPAATESDSTPSASPFESKEDATPAPKADPEPAPVVEKAPPAPVAEEPAPTPPTEEVSKPDLPKEDAPAEAPAPKAEPEATAPTTPAPEAPAAPSFGSPSSAPNFGSAPAPDATTQKDEPLPWETLPEESFDNATPEPKPTWELPEEPEPKADATAEDKQAEDNPWLKREAEAEKSPPPELPTKQFSGKERIKAMAPKVPSASELPIPPAVLRSAITVAAIVVVGFAGYFLFFKNNEKTTEMLARWTGAYNEISQEPTLGDEQVQVAMSTSDQPEEPAFEPMSIDRLQQPPEEGAELLTDSPYEEAMMTAGEEGEQNTEAGGTRIAVLSAPDAEAELQEPTDQLSMAERLQKALQEARAKRQQEAEVDPDIPTDDPVEQRRRDITRQAELERELAEYRKTLAQTTDPTELPKPGSFFRRERGEMADSGAAVYKANPNNLPLVNEPGMALAPQVRTLDAFDVDEFTPPTRRVQIPQGIAPGLQASEFPKLQLLSLIPNRGLIALRDGQQGVLLIGDTIQGWELTAVYQSYAEFQNRGRKYTMTLTPEIQQQGNS